MATWKVTPDWKKSTIERSYFKKDDNVFMHEVGWRWGEFLLYTEDDTPPELEPGVNLYDCEYECELVETSDGCWGDYDYDDCSEEAAEWLQNFFDEGNSPWDLEEHGWQNIDTEMIIDCDMTVEKVEE